MLDVSVNNENEIVIIETCCQTLYNNLVSLSLSFLFIESAHLWRRVECRAVRPERPVHLWQSSHWEIVELLVEIVFQRAGGIASPGQFAWSVVVQDGRLISVWRIVVCHASIFVMVHFGFHQQMARHCHLHHVVVRHRHVVGVDSVSYGRPIRRPAPNCFVFFVSQVAQIFVFVAKNKSKKKNLPCGWAVGWGSSVVVVVVVDRICILDGRADVVSSTTTSSVLLLIRYDKNLNFINCSRAKSNYFGVDWLPGRLLCRMLNCRELGFLVAGVSSAAWLCPLQTMGPLFVYIARRFDISYDLCPKAPDPFTPVKRFTNRVVDDGRMTLSNAWRWAELRRMVCPSSFLPRPAFLSSSCLTASTPPIVECSKQFSFFFVQNIYTQIGDELEELLELFRWVQLLIFPGRDEFVDIIEYFRLDSCSCCCCPCGGRSPGSCSSSGRSYGSGSRAGQKRFDCSRCSGSGSRLAAHIVGVIARISEFVEMQTF